MSARAVPPPMQAQQPFAAVAAEPSMQAWKSATGFLTQTWMWIQARKTARLDSRRLKVVETASLGDKRFVAVVQVDKMQFLIGGGPTGVAMLAALPEPVVEVNLFGEMLKKASRTRKKPTAKKPVAKCAAKVQA